MRLCLCVFLFSVFFFKQKTAYEMRISDWSSDVCSSDLGRPIGGAADAPVVMEGDDVKVHFPIRKGVLKRTVDYVRAVDGISVTVREEIGRASCRERVCQYV